MAFRDIADAWASFYANSPAIRSGITFAHLGALVVGGGSAIAADLGTSRALRADPAHLVAEFDRLRGSHRLVLASLAVVVLSGLLLTLADFDAYVASTAFWIKMALFAGLIVNGAMVVRTTTVSVALSDPRRIRALTTASLVLWLATTLMGTVVPNAL